MKHSLFVVLSVLVVAFACNQKPKEEASAEQPQVDSTAQVTEEQPQSNPVVVQIGAFKRSKNAEARAAQVSGASVVQEGNLKKVFVTAQNEDEVAQLKQVFSGQDQPFRRLDK